MDTLYPQQTTQTRLASDTADNICWERHSTTATPAGSRISFETVSSTKPVHKIIELASQMTIDNRSTANGPKKSLIVFAGRSRRMAVENFHADLREVLTEYGAQMSSSVPRTLGDIGAALVAANVNANLLIVQAGHHGSG